VQERLSKNIEAMHLLVSCRSLQDFVAAQSDIAGERFAHTVESGRRLAEVSARVAEEAVRSSKYRASARGFDRQQRAPGCLSEQPHGSGVPAAAGAGRVRMRGLAHGCCEGA